MSDETEKRETGSDAPTDAVADDELDGVAGGASSIAPTLTTETESSAYISKTKVALEEGKKLR